MIDQKQDALIRKKELLKIIQLSDRTVYNLEKKGEFPKRISLSARCVAWKMSEINKWIAERTHIKIPPMRPNSILSK